MPTATIAEPADAPAPAVTSLSAAPEEVPAPRRPASRPSRSPRRRPALSRPPPLPRAAPFAAAGRRRDPGRLRPARVDPVRPDRRSPAGTTISSCCPGSRGYRREQADALLYETRALYETYNKGLSLVPTAELPWYRVSWDRVRRQHEGGAFDEHAQLVEELLSPDPRRVARCRRPTSSRGRRSTGTGARRTRSGRILEALGEAGILGLARRDGQPPRLRPRRAAVPRRDPRDGGPGPRPVPAQAAVPLPRARAARDDRAARSSGRHGTVAETGQEDGMPLKSAGRRVLLAELRGARRPRPRRDRGSPRACATCPSTELDRLVPGRARGRGRITARRRCARRRVPGRPRPARLGSRLPADACSTSITSGRCTSPPRSGAGATTSCPMLFGDRLVGRIEPRIERKTDTLRVAGLWWEDGFDPLARSGFVDAFAAALTPIGRSVGCGGSAWPRAARHRELGRLVRDRVGRSPRPRRRPGPAGPRRPRAGV